MGAAIIFFPAVRPLAAELLEEGGDPLFYLAGIRLVSLRQPGLYLFMPFGIGKQHLFKLVQIQDLTFALIRIYFIFNANQQLKASSDS